MPDASTFTGDTVPLGQAGTGAAYILPQSQAIQQAGDYIDQAQQAKAAAAVAKLKQAQDLANAWQKNRFEIKAGTLWQPEINAKANDVVQQGLALRKAGINPTQYYNDPAIQGQLDAYNKNRQDVMNMAEARDKYAEQAKGVDRQIDESVPGEIDQQSVDQFHNFFKQPLSHIMANGYQIPNIRKSYDIQKDVDALPTSKLDTTTLPDKNGVINHLILPNSDAHQQTAENFVNNKAQVRSMIENKTGVPYEQIPTTTDVATIKNQLDNYYRSKPNVAQVAGMGIPSFIDPRYDDMLNQKAQAMANAAKVKQNTVDMVKGQLDDKVGKTNDQKLSFAYQQEQDRRERLGMERQKFGKWLEDQQNEAGSFTFGNQNSYVPVAKQYADQSIKNKSAGAEPEKGASLFGVNLPGVATVVRPAKVTNMKTGLTTDNTEPISVKVSQIQMVPVFKGLPKEGFNGSEISARQLKDIISGKNKDGANLNNITFQPYAYGIKSEHDANNVHTINTPVKFSYDAIKGSGIKKINTRTFDDATDQLKQLQSNPKFQGLSPQQKIDFLSQKYNLKLD